MREGRYLQIYANIVKLRNQESTLSIDAHDLDEAEVVDLDSDSLTNLTTDN